MTQASDDISPVANGGPVSNTVVTTSSMSNRIVSASPLVCGLLVIFLHSRQGATRVLNFLPSAIKAASRAMLLKKPYSAGVDMEVKESPMRILKELELEMCDGMTFCRIFTYVLHPCRL